MFIFSCFFDKVTITVRQLLNHTSGIRHYKPDNDPVDHVAKPIDSLLKTLQKAAESPFFKVVGSPELI